MFLELNHQKMEVFKSSGEFVIECYSYVKHSLSKKNLE